MPDKTYHHKIPKPQDRCFELSIILKIGKRPGTSTADAPDNCQSDMGIFTSKLAGSFFVKSCNKKPHDGTENCMKNINNYILMIYHRGKQRLFNFFNTKVSIQPMVFPINMC